MSYPFDAVEFNSGMSAIFGSPFLKKLAASEDQIGKSRYAIFAEENAKEKDNIKILFLKNSDLFTRKWTTLFQVK